MSIVDVDPYLAVQWDRWLKRRSEAARDHLIVSYSPLVKFIAGRLGAGLPSTVDPADLVSSGILGLIDALERFDPGQGVKFETFATPRIRGAIYDGLRQLDWVPRSVRTKARDVQRAMASFEAPSGRSPNDEELAGELGIERGVLDQWLASMASTTSVPSSGRSTPAPSRRRCRGEAPAVPSKLVEEPEVRARSRAEIGKLPDREKLVLSLYYDDGLTLAQIGTRARRQREPRAPAALEVGAAPAVPPHGGRIGLSDARPGSPRRTEEVRMRPTTTSVAAVRRGAFIADTAVALGAALAVLVAAPPGGSVPGVPAAAGGRADQPPVRGAAVPVVRRPPRRHVRRRRRAPSCERWRRERSRSAGSSSTCATSSCATVTGCWRRTAGCARPPRGRRAVADRLAVGGRPGELYFGLRTGPDTYIDPAPLIGALVVPPYLVPTDGTPRRPPPAPELRC